MILTWWGYFRGCFLISTPDICHDARDGLTYCWCSSNDLCNKAWDWLSDNLETWTFNLLRPDVEFLNISMASLGDVNLIIEKVCSKLNKAIIPWNFDFKNDAKLYFCGKRFQPEIEFDFNKFKLYNAILKNGNCLKNHYNFHLMMIENVTASTATWIII